MYALKRIFTLFLVFCLQFLTGCAQEQEGFNDNDTSLGALQRDSEAEASTKRLSSNSRNAVVLEAFYALDPSYSGSSSKSITTGGGTWLVSDWNYLNNDEHAYYIVYKGDDYYGEHDDFGNTGYECYSSDWSYACTSSYTCGATSPCYARGTDSFYDNPANFGYSKGGGSTYYGRGGQCMYFANLILYRSASDQHLIPNQGTLYARRTSSTSSSGGTRDIPAKCAQKGDVVYRVAKSGSSYSAHFGIVVDILAGSSSSCTVTSIDVVDSNLVSDTGAINREIIARHIINNAGSYLGEDLDNYYVYTGVSYYSTSFSSP